MDAYIQQNNTNILINSLANLSDLTDHDFALIASFDPISLAEMNGVKLMNRIDTKYIINKNQLIELLKKAPDNYRIVEIEDKRIIPYSTIYFDTEDKEMYIMHHNGKLNRRKVRMRSYINSGISFLEVKVKNNKGRTKKKRIVIPNEQFSSMHLNENEHEFLTKMEFDASKLSPQIQNSFKRITLVDKNLTERITIDMQLKFENIKGNREKEVSDLVIVELKQEGSINSPFRQYLTDIRAKSSSISKYCIGMTLINPDLKGNRFKKKIRKINKITNNNYATV